MALVHTYICLVGKYSPVTDGFVCTSVVGIGLVGVWRLIDLEYRKSVKDVTSDILRETYFQPESHGYVLTKIQIGMLLCVTSNSTG